MQKLVFSPTTHNSLVEEWLPHRNCSDTWSILGQLEDVSYKGNKYLFRLDIHLISSGLKLFCDTYFSFTDIQHKETFERRILIKDVDKERNKSFYVDSESLFLDEQVQILLDKNALAMRLIFDNFSMDMRVDRKGETQWLGDKGSLRLASGPKQISTLIYGHVPFCPCTGRITIGERTSSLSGRGVIDRMWGIYPFLNARTHGERIHLLMNDGRDHLLLNYPYGGQSFNYRMSSSGIARTMEGGSFSATDYLELDEWRFAKEWKFDFPGDATYPLLLTPLLEDKQFQLPVCHPVLAVSDQEGKLLGYGFAELAPGARNEIKKVPLKLYLHGK